MFLPERPNTKTPLIDTEIILEKLKQTSAKRVTLQLPEGLKRESPQLAAALKKAGYEVIISGDACWGACDLDLDAAKNSDVLVHIGHTPVTPEKNVIYLPFHQDVDCEILEKAVPKLTGYQKVGLITTIQHAHEIGKMADKLKECGVNAVIGKGSSRTPIDGQVLGCTYTAATLANADAYLFVGTGVFHAIGVSLAAKKPVFALDPYAGTIQEVSAERLLRKRFVQIEKAKDAKNFGILLSSKSGQTRRELAERLANLHPNAVVISIREVSGMQLCNLGFDAYVNTACPRLSMDDQSRFSMPVLSPAEFEIVLGLREWDDYIIDEIV